MVAEEYLWKTINYYENDATRTDDVKKVLEFYELYMSTIQFGEIGIFRLISTEWFNDPLAFELAKQIANVNMTYVQAFTYIKHKSYIDILKFANQLPNDISAHYSRFFLDYMRSYFWELIQNVKRI